MIKVCSKMVLTLPLALLLVGCGESHDPKAIDIPGIGVEQARPLDGWTQKLIKPYLDWNVSRGLRSGYVVAAARDGELQYLYSNGFSDIEAGKSMGPETRFNIASMTKPVTAVAAMQLISTGKLSLEDPVSKYIPAFAGVRVALSADAADGEFPTEPVAKPLSIRELLNFQAGMGQGWNDSPTDLDRRWSDYDARAAMNLAQLADAIAAIPLQEQPGQYWRYGLSLDVMARIIEIVANEPFEDYLHSNIFLPLGMMDTGFMLPEHQRDDLAVRYGYNEAGDLTPVDWSPWDAKSRVRGGSGLVSTVSDYLRFALMLQNGGVYNGARILSEEAFAQMTALHVPEGVLAQAGLKGLGWGLGIAVVADADASLFADSNGDLFWSGAWGTHFWVSRDKGVSLVIMQQQALETFSMGDSRGQEVPYIVQELLLRAAKDQGGQ